MSKYCISMIIFTNPLYLVGACLSAWVHRQFITKYNLNIELMVMVDETIYKYKNELENYFDKIELIKLEQIKLNPQYKVIHKYSRWMKYSISKWNIFKFDFYDKILFIDIDILPITKDFYNIFDFETPAIMVKGINQNNLVNKNLDKNFFIRINEKQENFEPTSLNYWNLSLKLTKSLDAGLVLIKPDKKLYTEYFDFIKICEGMQGYISKYDSGVDETTLLFFFIFHKQIPTHLIPYDYAPVPWEKNPYNKNNIKGINFLSLIKPWTKLPIIQFSDENIWHKIAKRVLQKHSIITNIYIKYLIDTLYDFFDELKINMSKSNSPYNMECVKSPKVKSHTYSLQKYIQTHPKEKLSMEQIEWIIKKSVHIHKYMDKRLIVGIGELKNFIAN